MFDDVLVKAKGSDDDLGRVVLSQSAFHNPIVVPLQKWENIDTNKVMEAVERVLNSDENSNQVVIGNIAVPSGRGTLPITRLEGENDSRAIKRSILKKKDDHLCLASAISRCFLRLCKIVTLTEWNEITKGDDASKTNTTMSVIKHRVATKSFF